MAVIQLLVNLTTSYDIENQRKGAGAYDSQGQTALKGIIGLRNKYITGNKEDRQWSMN